jgi:putative PIN family toxin of toxin-antitoxin system
MAKNKSLRIVIDTNLWISFIISSKLDKLDSFLCQNKIKIVFSEELITELNKTITKPKLKKYFTDSSIEEMLLTFELFVDLVDVKIKVNACRDPKDNFLLSLSKDGKANFLITGDKDLLELKSFGTTKIITFTKFIEELKN